MQLQQDNGTVEKVCRICCLSDEPILCPCKCRGSIKYVHSECLFEWMKERGKSSCEICDYKIEKIKVYKANTPERVPNSYIAWYFLEWLWKIVKMCSELCFVMLKVLFTIFVASWGGLCVFGEEIASNWWHVTIISIVMLIVGFIQSIFLFIVDKITRGGRRIRIDTQRTIGRLETEEYNEVLSDNMSETVRGVFGTDLNCDDISDIYENNKNTENNNEHNNNTENNSEHNNTENITNSEYTNSTNKINKINNNNNIENITNSSINSFNNNTGISNNEILEDIDEISEDGEGNDNIEMEDILVFFRGFFSPFCSFNGKKEITQVLLLVWFSLFVIVYKKLFNIFSLAFSNTSVFNYIINILVKYRYLVELPVSTDIFKKNKFARMIDFDVGIFIKIFRTKCIFDQLVNMWKNLIFCVLILIFLNVLRNISKKRTLRTAYYFAKIELLVFVGSCFLFNLIGISLHGFLCATNNKFSHPDWSLIKYGFLFYTFVGLLINLIFKQFIVELSIRLRPGAIYNVHSEKHNYFFVFKAIIRNSYVNHIFICLRYIIIMLFILFVGVIVNMKYLPLENMYSAFTVRLFFFLCTTFKEFSSVLVCLLLWLSKRLIRQLKLNNYLFNEPIKIDKYDRLVWDYNSNISYNVYSSQLNNANSVLQKSIKENNQSLIKENIKLKNHQSLIKENQQSSDMVFDSLNTFGLEKNSNFGLCKYKLTRQNIKQFFAKKQNSKFALFYKPQFFKLRLFLIVSLWFTLIHAILFLFFKLSHTISLFFNVSSSLNIPLFLLFIKLFSIIVKNCFENNVLIDFIKSFILYFYSDFLVPTLCTVIYIIMFVDFDTIFFFSRIWAMANLLSFVFHSFLLQFSMYDSVASMSFRYIFKIIFFWFTTKLFIFALFCVLKYYTNFLSMIYIILTISCCYGISVLASFIANKKLLQIIKDHYFIKEELIKNVDDSK